MLHQSPKAANTMIKQEAKGSVDKGFSIEPLESRTLYRSADVVAK